MSKIKGWTRWKAVEKKKGNKYGGPRYAWMQTPMKSDFGGWTIKVRRNSYQSVIIVQRASGYRIILGNPVQHPMDIGDPKTKKQYMSNLVDVRTFSLGRPWREAPGSNKDGFFSNKEKARKAAVKLMKRNSEGIINESEIR